MRFNASWETSNRRICKLDFGHWWGKMMWQQMGVKGKVPFDLVLVDNSNPIRAIIESTFLNLLNTFCNAKYLQSNVVHAYKMRSLYTQRVFK